MLWAFKCLWVLSHSHAPNSCIRFKYRNNTTVSFSHLGMELNHVYFVPLGPSQAWQEFTGVSWSLNTKEVYWWEHSLAHPGPCQRASSNMLSFSNTLSFAVPYARLLSPFNHRASPGSGENVCQPSYRKPAQAWPSSKKSYTCCSTRLFLRNNHLYSGSIGIHLLPLRWDQTHSNIPKIHTPQSIDASWLLGIANAYHTRALTDGGSSTKRGPRPKRSVPRHYHGTAHTSTYPVRQLLTLCSHWGTWSVASLDIHASQTTCWVGKT